MTFRLSPFSRRGFMGLGAAAAAAGAFRAWPRRPEPSLASLAKAKGVRFGSAVGAGRPAR
jgi:endo-1,4-beta-xylanase